MGQGISAPQDLSGYARTADLANYVKASDRSFIRFTDLQNYVKNTELADYVKDIELDQYKKDADGQFVKIPQLANYVEKSDTTYVKVADLQNYVKVADKATVDTDPNSQSAYVTPGYMRGRLNDTWTATGTDPDNTSNKFVTPLLMKTKLDTTWTALNADPDTTNNKFVTPAFLADRLTNTWTVKNTDSDTSTTKFVTPDFLANRLNTARTNWTAAETETAGNTFVTAAGQTSRINRTKIDWTANDTEPDTSTSKFVTPQFLDNKIKSKWTVRESDEDLTETTVNNRFVTPVFLKKIIDKTESKIPSRATSGPSGYMTPDDIAAEYATKSYVDNRDITYSLSRPDIVSISNSLIAPINDTTPSQFVSAVAPQVARENRFLPKNLADELFTLARRDAFMNNLTSNIMTNPTHGQAIVTGLQQEIQRNRQLQSALRGPPGDFGSEENVREKLAPRTMWCATGEMCGIPSSSNGFVLAANQVIQSTGGNAVIIKNNINTPGFIQFGDNAEKDTVQGTPQANKFDKMDARIELINFKDSQSEQKKAQKSSLNIYGGARALLGADSIERGKRRIKMFDDVMIDNKLAIGKDADVDPEFDLIVGGAAKFKDITVENANITSNMSITGKTTLSGDVEIAGKTKTTGDTEISTNATIGNLYTNSLTAGGPANFTNNVNIQGELKAETGNTTIKNLNTSLLTANQTAVFKDGIAVTGGNIVATNSDITAKNLNLSGNLNISGAGYLTNFDAYTNGNDATFVPNNWSIDANGKLWDPLIRGEVNRKGFAYNQEQDETNASGSTATYDVPSGMKTGYLIHLPWYNSRYFDIYGIRPTTNNAFFIKRVNAYNPNTNSIEESPGRFHDGINLVSIPGVDRFAKIRIQGRKGRMHLMGIGWSKSNLGSSGETGYVHMDNLRGNTLVFDDGGGWFMADNTWLRSHNNKSIFAGTGTIATDGSISAGTSDPAGHKLRVKGTTSLEGTTSLGGDTTVSGRLNIHGPVGNNHFPWSGNNENYIRGTTNHDSGDFRVTGNTSVTGQSTVTGKVRSGNNNTVTIEGNYAGGPRVRFGNTSDEGSFMQIGAWDNENHISNARHLNIHGNTTFKNDLTVAGNINLKNNTNVSGALKLTTNPTITNDNAAAYFWDQSGVGPTIAGANFEVRTGGDTRRLLIDSAGNTNITGNTKIGGNLGVGITLSDPAEKLDVLGNVKITGKLIVNGRDILKELDERAKLATSYRLWNARANRVADYNENTGGLEFTRWPSESSGSDHWFQFLGI